MLTAYHARFIQNMPNRLVSERIFFFQTKIVTVEKDRTALLILNEFSV